MSEEVKPGQTVRLSDVGRREMGGGTAVRVGVVCTVGTTKRSRWHGRTVAWVSWVGRRYNQYVPVEYLEPRHEGAGG